MSKHLNADSITNELEGSAFFPRRTPASQPEEAQPVADPVPLVPPVRGDRGGRPVPPGRRVMKQRHPFDIYRDQYEALRELALEERKQGGVGSMSAMVRQAIDQLVAEKRSLKK
jgi:hypothetical protein